MRMFVALVPPESAVEDLDEFLAPRRESAGEAGLRWSLPEQLHVTLAFLAQVEERRLDDLVERLGRATRRRTPVATNIAGGGAFPHAASARVLWAGLRLDDDGRNEIARLATGARAAASKAGIVVDGQRFRPHVTVARLGRPVEATRWVRLLDAYSGPAWQTTDVALVASYLGEGPRGRPRYETVATYGVGAGGPLV